MTEELLPVGSIVKIRFSKLKYMIIGYYTSDVNTKEKYDYVAVDYPIGLITMNDVAGFPMKNVKEVIHKGLETEDSKKFLTDLKREVDKAKLNNTVVQVVDDQKIDE